MAGFQERQSTQAYHRMYEGKRREQRGWRVKLTGGSWPLCGKGGYRQAQALSIALISSRFVRRWNGGRVT